MRHYEIVFIVHPDQSEQVPGMVERYRQMITGRGGKGRELMQRGGFTRVVPTEVAVPVIEGQS